MTIAELLNELVQPKGSGCTSRQSYQHCDPNKYEEPDCRRTGNPDHC